MYTTMYRSPHNANSASLPHRLKKAPVSGSTSPTKRSIRSAITPTRSAGDKAGNARHSSGKGASTGGDSSTKRTSPPPDIARFNRSTLVNDRLLKRENKAIRCLP
ncbi:hypothetical protein [Pauljensenia hongkongensis]|uniref:hypothetical protein n=1 Tax=Pauljensenia hongkongensis TaxID=178339 RepID=UPI0002EF83EC|nr:hypothetical protein [Pauljensenia hongkongensis]